MASFRHSSTPASSLRNRMLWGGPAYYTRVGGPGDDTLDGGNGVDHLDGGPDIDACTRGDTTAECEAQGRP